MDNNNLDRVRLSEADAWYLRNRSVNPGSLGPSRGLRVVLAELDKLSFRPSASLEIGACDGYNLVELERKFGTPATGIEISQKAVDAGNRTLSELSLQSNLIQGSGNELPFPDESFDLVFLGFMLYISDQELLADYYQEALRVLKFGGIVATWDFYPTKSKPVYRHDPDIKVNKVDHTQALLERSPDTMLLSFTTMASERVTSRTSLDKSEMVSLILKVAS